MGCKFSKASPSPNPGAVLTPVVLNVYDLSPLNNYTYWVGFGIFHSGIEGKLEENKMISKRIACGYLFYPRKSFYGMEYGFGAHDYPTSGVFEVEPKSCPGFSYRRSLTLGYTSMLPFEFREFVDNISSEYHGDEYHLISKNCNHFTNDVCLRLTGKQIPKWVNRLAYFCGLCCCILPKSLRIEAVKGEPRYSGLSDHSTDPLNRVS